MDTSKEKTNYMIRDDADQVLDKEQWQLEAQILINDVKKHVQDLKVSEQLTSTNQVVYLNLTTLEGLQFCVELSSVGFTIIGNQHDDMSNIGNEHFETPYSLLDFISPQYRNSFGNLLLDKLKELSNQQQI